MTYVTLSIRTTPGRTNLRGFAFQLSAPQRVQNYLNQMVTNQGGKLITQGDFDGGHEYRVDDIALETHVLLSWIEECFGPMLGFFSATGDSDSSKHRGHYIFRQNH